METWKIVVIAIVAIAVIAVAVWAVVHFSKKKNDNGNGKATGQQTFVPPLARRERYVKGSNSSSLDNFITKYIDVESGNWN